MVERRSITQCTSRPTTSSLRTVSACELTPALYIVGLMKLKCDFVSDWISILKDILENHWGYDTTEITYEQIPIVYFDAEKRRPEKRPRKVILSDTFICPRNLNVGWSRLKVLI